VRSIIVFPFHLFIIIVTLFFHLHCNLIFFFFWIFSLELTSLPHCIKWLIFLFSRIYNSCPYSHNNFSGFMILMYIFETYLDMRQHAALKLPTLPKTLEGVISQEKFEKSRAYSLDKRFVLLVSVNSYIGVQWNSPIKFPFDMFLAVHYMFF
jgi:hypothetical protein